MFFCKVRWFFEKLYYRLGIWSINARMNLLPDSPDERDYIYAGADNYDSLPHAINLKDQFPDVEDQAHAASCTANAVVGVLEYYKRTVGRSDELSRRFLYRVTRNHECTNSDRGSGIRSAIKMSKKFGVPSEEIDPYDLSRINDQPSQAAYMDAKSRVIVTKYSRVVGSKGVVSAVADAKPVIFGARIYSDFYGVSKDRPIATRGGSYSGGHAMVVVGYSKYFEQFVVRNSWGTGWGDGGYCIIPFSWFDDKGIVFDAWTIETREIPEEVS